MKNNTEQDKAAQTTFKRIDMNLTNLFSDIKEFHRGSDAVDGGRLSRRIEKLEEQLNQLKNSDNPVISQKVAEYERHTNQLKKMMDIAPDRGYTNSRANRA